MVTADNYTLGVFRIPYGRAGPGTAKRPPVLLQHGLVNHHHNAPIPQGCCSYISKRHL